MKRFQDYDYWVFLAWLVVMGFTTFGIVVCWNEGLLALLYASDRSHICLVIGLLYLLGCGHCARRAFYLASEIEHARVLDEHIGDRIVLLRHGDGPFSVEGHALDPDSVLGGHLRVLARRGEDRIAQAQDGEQSTLVATLIAHAKGSQDIGWFLVDVLLKLGLLGTIVGFILMLGSVADTSSLDVNTMQKVLKQMSNGMGTALYTTLAGLVGSMSLGLQYLLLDKGADALIERILRLTDAKLATAA
ncbi:MAG: MotA/TolQ/ExbB proton channel family protein [Gammaproteobacteria bacterium]